MARLEGLEPHFRANAEALVAASGGRIWFVSAVRTDAEQVVLWNRYITQGGPVAAKPRSLGGTGSKHTDGLAIDFGGDMGLLARLAPAYLMVRTVPSENWHYEPLWSRNSGVTPRSVAGGTPAAPGVDWAAIAVEVARRRQETEMASRIIDGHPNVWAVNETGQLVHEYETGWDSGKNQPAVGHNAGPAGCIPNAPVAVYLTSDFPSLRLPSGWRVVAPSTEPGKFVHWWYTVGDVVRTAVV